MLPKEIRELDGINTFRSKVHKFLIENDKSNHRYSRTYSVIV